MTKNIIGQDSIPYFPQEKILINTCENMEDAASCFYDFLENKVSKIVNENITQFNKLEIDTLELSGRLILDQNNTVDKNKSYFNIQGKNIDKLLNQKFKSIFKKLPITKVLNKKSTSNPPYHIVNFKYLLDYTKSAENIAEILPSKKSYSGGVIGEVPRFPGCESFNESEARLCFQQKMQEHIRTHFRYPEQAQRRGLSGRVSVIFIISKNGEIENIRTRGPHEILEEDVVRIIKLLPKMTPGKENGEAVKVPFSIPINYRLR